MGGQRGDHCLADGLGHGLALGVVLEVAPSWWKQGDIGAASIEWMSGPVLLVADGSRQVFGG